MERLKIEADRLLVLSIAKNTHKTYENAWNAFIRMCSETDIRPVLPISRSNLIAFIAHLSITGKKASTISSYVSGLSFFHKCQNYDDPADCFVVRKMLEGCRRDRPSIPDFRHPLTQPLLQQAVKGAQLVCNSIYETYLFQAAMTLAFYAFLRVGEFTTSGTNQEHGRALQMSDIALKVSVSGGKRIEQVHVTIRFSKTDQSGRSTTLIISESGDGQNTCPVLAMKQYLAMRTQGAGQLFWHFDKSPLTRYQFSAVVKKSLLAKNVSSQGITSHSFRIGACTHFAMAGFSDEDLMKMGRWTSSAYQRYIRIPGTEN